MPEQDSGVVPDPVKVVVPSVHDNAVLETESASVTVPVNPLAYVTEIVDEPGAPDRAVMLVGLALTLKAFATVKITVVLWDKPPIKAVTVTVKDPEFGEDAVHVREEDADVVDELRATLVGFREQDRPDVGGAVESRLRVPVNPFVPVAVIVDEAPEGPGKMVRLVGLADKAKSCTVTVTVVV